MALPENQPCIERWADFPAQAGSWEVSWTSTRNKSTDIQHGTPPWMNKEGGDLILLLRCSLISSYFIHCSLLWLVVVSNRIGVKSFIQGSFPPGISLPPSPGWVTGSPCFCQITPGHFCSAIISIPTWSWKWERLNLNKTKILFFSQLNFSIKSKQISLSRWVCIEWSHLHFSAETEIKNKFWAPEPFQERIFCVHTLLQI